MKALWFRNQDETKKDSLHSNKKSNVKATIEPLIGYELKEDNDLMGKVNIDTMCLVQNSGVKVRLENLFDSTLEIIDEYFICNGCGNIYWVKKKIHVQKF